MKKIQYIPLAIFCFMTNYSIAQVSTNFNNENFVTAKGQFQKEYVQIVDFILPQEIKI